LDAAQSAAKTPTVAGVRKVSGRAVESPRESVLKEVESGAAARRASAVCPAPSIHLAKGHLPEQPALRVSAQPADGSARHVPAWADAVVWHAASGRQPRLLLSLPTAWVLPPRRALGRPHSGVARQPQPYLPVQACPLRRMRLRRRCAPDARPFAVPSLARISLLRAERFVLSVEGGSARICRHRNSGVAYRRYRRRSSSNGSTPR